MKVHILIFRDIDNNVIARAFADPRDMTHAAEHLNWDKMVTCELEGYHHTKHTLKSFPIPTEGSK